MLAQQRKEQHEEEHRQDFCQRDDAGFSREAKGSPGERVEEELLVLEKLVPAEADHLGLELMNAAGYDPNEMAVVFGRLAEQQHSLPSVVERFFSSHPLSENRMRDAERRAAALPRPAHAPVGGTRASTFSEINLMFAKD